MIIVFGSINLDIMVPVERMPVPGETVLGGDCIMSPGGKGANQAHAARLAGADVALVGKVGGDAFAEPALTCLRAAGVDLGRVGRSATHPTGCATIWVDAEGGSTIVVSPGANRGLKASDLDDETLARASLLLLQQEVPMDEMAEVAARAHRAGLRVVLNAAPAMPVPDGLLACVDDLIVNEIELRQIAASAGLGDASPAALASRTGTRVVATYGAQGLVHHHDGTELRLPAHAVEAVDTTAAGDTFVGVYCACLARGLAEADALGFANRAAALACTRRGAQASQPGWDEIAAG